MTQTILVVDDEPAVSDLLVYNLRKAGFEPVTALNGREALLLVQQIPFDLILLDLMLPEVDGLEVCREIRKSSAVPIIMITARGEEIDRVVGLELGADDYVCKPFSVRELLARVKAVLRRSQSEDKPVNPNSVTKDSLTLDRVSRSVAIAGSPIDLTRLEFDVLDLFLSHPGRVFTREQLLEQAWGYDFYGDTRAVDSTMKRLRAKMRMAGMESEMIEAVRGIGYRLGG
ncbi:MAG: DNA-binding response regulator [Chloroflexi bacterium HGW-Chloroflexi-10]|nr:MAG: DNA-binding response regulator [Chloroflexi bacterium HGW-Chloroflexi-10]